MPLNSRQSIFVSAGEFSGDLLAADLVHALRRVNYKLDFFGTVGPTMTEAGVVEIASIDELSVMGILEVARKICEIGLVEKRILTWIDRMQPLCAVLVDFPGFHFRLAEQLKLRGIPVFQYVAPKVWAWGKGRLPQLRENFTKVLGILPFEEEFFLNHGVNYEYVGSPHWDRMSKLEIHPEDLGIASDQKVIAFLPGSRTSEISRILPDMVQIRKEFEALYPNCICVIPLAPTLPWSEVAKHLGEGVSADIEVQRFGFKAAGFLWLNGCSLELMKMATAAVVASGTATLECALAGTPMIVVYKMNSVSYAIARKAVTIKWASLVNLLMNEEVVKEHLQTLDAKVIAKELLSLVNDSEERRKMLDKFDVLSAKLKPEAAFAAARAILATSQNDF